MAFMKRRLLDYLACSLCGRSFELRVTSEDVGEIIEGSLLCRVCGEIFPIIRGIPRFLPAQLSAEKHATAEAFGYEWTHYSQLSEQYRAEFLDWIYPIKPEDFRDRLVLDAGCGKGRHAVLAAEFGAREVIGVDLSEAVEAAYQNTRKLPNVHILQADIYHLPVLRPFDLFYSIGVLHHLPDPRQGFLSLVRHLHPGGRAVIWVYGKEGNWWIEKIVNPVRIHFTSRAPRGLTRTLSFLLSVPLYLALKLIYSPARSRPWLKKLLFYSDYLCEISRYSFAENFWNVFDHLVAPTAFYLSREEIEEWFASAGLAAVQITPRTNNSWRGTGIVPVASRMPLDATPTTEAPKR
jgi:SAM-dependent methyltransferase